MNLDRYEYERNQTYKEYEFYSEGPKGRIRKVVRFRLKFSNRVPYYYLIFGDWNEKENNIDDSSITNNGDTEKVLATVAAIIIHFTALFNEALVYAEGSSVARTRRYQIGINKMLTEIEKIFDVYGFVDEQWEPFQKNINYYAFLVRRKEMINLQEEESIYMTSSSQHDSKKDPSIFHDRINPDKQDAVEHLISEKEKAAQNRLDKFGFPKELLEKMGLKK